MSDLMGKYRQLEGHIVDMIKSAGSGHYASSMSALEIMYPLFYEEKISPGQFILSKGHAAPALYAILYDLGYIDDLSCFRQYGGLPGHPEIKTNGVLCSSGSLGMGISKAAGIARANPGITYHVLVGDGELQEGQNWEAIMYLIANHIENVIVHVDCNGQQYSGEVGDRGVAYLSLLYTEEILKCIRLHVTHWEKDNKYLTRPQTPEYNQVVQRYGERLEAIMKQNEKVIVLDADLMDDFGLRAIAEKIPDRFIECGISEQHMVSMANGLALSGYYPVCHTFGAFYKRCIDQIWNNYQDGIKVVYVAGLVGKHPLNIGLSHEAVSGKKMLSWLPDILVTSNIDDLKYLGIKSIYLEMVI
mgnify:FL=1